MFRFKMSFSLAQTTKLLSEYTEKKTSFTAQVQPLRFMADFSPVNMTINGTKYKDAFELKRAGVEPWIVAKACLEFLKTELVVER